MLVLLGHLLEAQQIAAQQKQLLLQLLVFRHQVGTGMQLLGQLVHQLAWRVGQIDERADHGIHVDTHAIKKMEACVITSYSIHYTKLYDGKYDYQASLQSNLKGLALALPEPYAKPAGTAWPLRLNLTGNETTSLLQGSLDKQLQLEAELLPQQGRFSRFWLMTPHQPRPEAPLAVDLQLERANRNNFV